MRHLSLFSGSGIGTLAAAACGITTVAHAENDPACCYCLERMWPDATLFQDVRQVTTEAIQDLGPIDIISGGFPCQDISTAGKGAGIEGKRSGLWVEMARIIREVRPRWVLAENVPALRSRGADRVLADLEEAGYAAWPLVVGAWAVGAPHKRDRVWIVGKLVESESKRCRAQRAEHAERGSSAAACSSAESMANGSREQRQQRAERDGVGERGEPGLANDSSERSGQRERQRQSAETGTGIKSGAQGSGAGTELANAAEQRRGQGGGESVNSNDTRPGETSRGGQAASVANASGTGREESASLGSHPATQQQAVERGGLCRWPARPGEFQHAWEAPRLVEFGVGDAVDGVARRIRSRANKAALRMVGNGWCYPIAEMMFRAIVELDANL